jgi:hypothetical protein
MDELQQQIQQLIQEAPNDGVTGPTVEAITPVLLAIAGRLKHRQYYILQTLNQSWVMTTLSSRREPITRKNVLYGFPTLQDAASDPVTSKIRKSWPFPPPSSVSCFRCWR